MGSSLAELYNRSPRVKVDTNAVPEFSFVLPEQLMGVEIEAEALGDVILPTRQRVGNFWNIINDGSLMHGQEYVLNNPMAGDTLSRAISTFFANSNLISCATSSTHIHLDMDESNTSPVTLQVLVALVYILEPVLWQVGDPSRKWCGYTHPVSMLPMRCISALFNENYSIRDGELVRQTDVQSRYYGLNLQALNKYGSLEFRYFPTATKASQLVTWINLVQSFKNAALNIGSMRALNSLMETEQGYSSIVVGYFDHWKDIIGQFVPYDQAHSSFLELTESFMEDTSRPKGLTIYDQAVTTNSGFSKIIKKRRVSNHSSTYSKINIARYFSESPTVESLVDHGITFLNREALAVIPPASSNSTTIIVSNRDSGKIWLPSMLANSNGLASGLKWWTINQLCGFINDNYSVSIRPEIIRYLQAYGVRNIILAGNYTEMNNANLARVLSAAQATNGGLI